MASNELRGRKGSGELSLDFNSTQHPPDPIHPAEGLLDFIVVG